MSNRSEKLAKLKDFAERELKGRIIPFWCGLIDERGGYFGKVDETGRVERNADKGAVMHSRVLWFFSKCAIRFGEEYIKYCEHAYRFLSEKLSDGCGGLIWSVDCNGNPLETDKYLYADAFYLYALSAYGEIGSDDEVKARARQAFEHIENRFRDERSYVEAFDGEYRVIYPGKLADRGVYAYKTMNALLHLLEAYTEYYRVFRDERARTSLMHIEQVILRYIYDENTRSLKLFFDQAMNCVSDIRSFGHDIEASWLFRRADAIAGTHFGAKGVVGELSEQVYREGYDGIAVINETEGGTTDTDRIWWVQAEAVTGFMYAASDTSTEGYLDAALNIAGYIEGKLATGKEWLWGRTKSGEPMNNELAGIWKCPYHNGRMCFELLSPTFNRE